jgi:hypothetical protein
VEDLKSREKLEYVDVDDRIILIFFFNIRGCGLDLYKSEQRLLAGSCEHDNRLKGFVTGREYYSYWSNHEFLQTNSVAQVIITK